MLSKTIVRRSIVKIDNNKSSKLTKRTNANQTVVGKKRNGTKLDGSNAIINAQPPEQRWK